MQNLYMLPVNIWKQEMNMKKLLCIGHRGAMGHAPENTLASIQKALELGTPCMEIDVYYVDGQLVVFHDHRLERTTNGSGFLVDQKFSDLRTLDAGNGEKIPTLQEVFETIHLKPALNIELKGTETTRPVLEFISNEKKTGLKENFNLDATVYPTTIRSLGSELTCPTMTASRMPFCFNA
mgnify:CR=1 FL=1